MPPKKAKKKPTAQVPAAPQSDSDHDEEFGDLVPELAGDDNPPPDGYRKLTDKEIREYHKFAGQKSLRKDHATQFTCLYELARARWPDTTALMSSLFGPLISCPRRDPPSDEGLQQLVFGELLRLQSTLSLSKDREYIVSFPISFIRLPVHIEVYFKRGL